ncbi:MAG: hypothetical protein JRE40_04220 [Deltaproteobacteria bacterium]|nr:hypothetical protein [Deltaproteobacteria bacterium]
MIQVSYHFFDNPVLEEIVRSNLTPLMPLLPSWLDSMRVESFGSGDEQQAMDITLSIPYRRACIRVYPDFYDASPEGLHEIMLHEVAHTWIGPVVEWVRVRLLERFSGDHKETLCAEFEERVEAMTQSLAVTLEQFDLSTDGKA